MRILALNTFLSLDGVMQSPGGPDEDPTGGFSLGGWGVPYFDEAMLSRMAELDPYELLLGRGTYEIFAAHWPYEEGPMADRLNSIRKFVVSTTLAAPEWNNTTVIAADSIADLKRTDGPEIQVHGSPALIQTLLERDLIDEYRIWIFPIVIGTGKRLFGDGAIPMGLRLVDSTTTSTGVTVNTYVRAGAVERGSFEFEEPTEAELARRERLT